MEWKDLSPKQQRVLEYLEKGPNCAYSMRVTMKTIRALVDRKLIVCRGGPGGMFSPQTMNYKITNDGLRVLQTRVPA